MRKFGCNILAVVQQYDIIKDSPVRGAMIGNSKMFVELKPKESINVPLLAASPLLLSSRFRFPFGF
jgi:hypothetical protein